MPLVCPQCGSRHLRYAHRRSTAELLWSLVGVRPLRCRDCRLRFTERTWRLGSLRYARCPTCWRMDLNTWRVGDYHASTGQLLLMQLGGRPYRCEYCRINFVSFRPRLEKFTFKRWKNHAARKEGTEAEAARRTVGDKAAPSPAVE